MTEHDRKYLFTTLHVNFPNGLKKFNFSPFRTGIIILVMTHVPKPNKVIQVWNV